MRNLAIIGGGNRGSSLTGHAVVSKKTKITAIVEIDENRRNLFRKKFGLQKENCFKDYKKFFKSNLDVDGVIIATLPNSHTEITCAFLNAGIPVFLEKPMAANLEDAAKIVRVAKKTETPIQLGFNCRYAPFFEKIKEIVLSGQLGKILSVEWKEVLSLYHWSSYNWHPSYNKRNMIGSWLLEKCCHDLDLMNWLIEAQCLRVASFGNRINFALPPIEIRPLVMERFTELKKDVKNGKIEWKTYKGISDLVDHQTSILEYQNGVTVSFSLLPLGTRDTRLVYICGTEATLEGDWELNKIRLFLYKNGKEVVCNPEKSAQDGHGGGDSKVISAFLNYLNNPGNKPKTGVEEGWEAMVMGCGIDLSLREHRVVELETLRNAKE